MTIFDLESAPIDTPFTRDLEPKIAPYPAFDESAVKTGNRVNPDAIHAAKQLAKERWERERLEHDHAHLKAVCDWEDSKTLNPLLSRTLSITWSTKGNLEILIIDRAEDEAAALKEFWKHHGSGDLAGWNIQGFDIPFLIERSQLVGVECPAFSTPLWNSPRVIDLMRKWNRNGDARKLDHVARSLGLPGKVDLGTFTRRDGLVRNALPHEVSREKLREYALRDVEIETAIAHVLFPDVECPASLQRHLRYVPNVEVTIEPRNKAVASFATDNDPLPF